MVSVVLHCVTVVVLVMCLPYVHSSPEEARLLRDLLGNYDLVNRQVRPVTNRNATVTLNHGLMMIDIQFDPESGILDGVFWTQMTWRDHNARWDPANYDNIEQMNVDLAFFWKPDIVLYSRINLGETVDTSVMARLMSNGHMLWIPPSFYKVRCSNVETDLDAAPEGTQYLCKLVFGSWVYHDTEVDMHLLDNQNPYINTDYFTENREWEVTFTSAQRHNVQYPCCEERYPNVEYKLGLKRRF